MKKLYTLLATCLLLLVFTPFHSIDAGVGHSRSGSSSRSHSSSSRSKSSSSSSSSSSKGSRTTYYSSYGSGIFVPGFSTIILLVVGAYVIYIFVKKSQDSSSSNQVETETWTHHKVENNSLAVNRIKNGDPNFDADSFNSWAKEV